MNVEIVVTGGEETIVMQFKPTEDSHCYIPSVFVSKILADVRSEIVIVKVFTFKIGEFWRHGAPNDATYC